MRKLNTLLGSAALLISSASGTMAMDGVVVSIKPIQSLVAGVMAGVANPEVIVSGTASPHAYSLKPSQARTLQDAKIVFWVGEVLEAFLAKPLQTLGENAKIVELTDIASLKKVELREGGAFDGHGHDDHEKHSEEGHDDHDKHDGDHDHSAKHHEEEKDHGKHDDHDKHEEAHGHADKHHDEDDDHDKHGDHDHSAKHHEEEKDHGKHDDHDKHEEDDDHAAAHHDAHEGFDPHIWLDPENAKIMVAEISKVLSDADPSNAETYASNAMKVVARLDDQSVALTASLEAVSDKPFVVFHDAYRYFEERYGLNAAGSITVNPDVAPGAARLSELRKKLKDLEAACVFSEPQFSSSIVDVLIEGTDARTAVLDPLGANIEQGPDLYFELMENMAASFKTCLSK
ncbi:MAG: zinc ABC transporter substrate-binding protein [Hyphomicrobiales bacterium]